jgi:hypothetical protein
MYEISASVLPSAHDCMRRTASKCFGARKPEESEFGKLLKSAGFPITEKQKRNNSYASALGTAVHAVLNECCANISQGKDIDIVSAYNAGEDVLLKECLGAEGDEITPSLMAAQDQMKRISTYAIEAVLDYGDIEIVSHEQRYQARLNEKISVSGHIDLIVKKGQFDQIKDWKFGKNGSGYEAQIGAYSILSRANGLNPAGQHCIEHFPRSKKVIKHESILINTENSEVFAFNTIKHISLAIKSFEKTGDHNVFMANPASQLCSPKFCPAFGTKFCSITTNKE